VRMTMFFWVVTPSGLVGVTAQSNNIVRYWGGCIDMLVCSISETTERILVTLLHCGFTVKFCSESNFGLLSDRYNLYFNWKSSNFISILRNCLLYGTQLVHAMK
jgi:hypothetical protein